MNQRFLRVDTGPRLDLSKNDMVNYEKFELVVGADEVGRGCVAGPVYAAAVILPLHFNNERVRDSKRMTPNSRKTVKKMIIDVAIDYAIGIVEPSEIDIMNIHHASILAMHRALDNLKIRPKHIIVDGKYFKNYHDVPHECIIKGDNKYFAIAAASIIAKVSRDEYMDSLHDAHPQYDWISNKGYLTDKHLIALQTYGITEHHRKSFRPVKKLITI